MNVEKTVKNLKLRGFEVNFFENKEAAADYLTSQIKKTTVGIGGAPGPPPKGGFGGDFF